jgi:hypothetical protein
VKVPSFMLKKLYMKESLENTDSGFKFMIKNTLMDATLINPVRLTVDNRPIPEETITIEFKDESLLASEISEENPVSLKVDVKVTVSVQANPLKPGNHALEIASTTKEFGDIGFSVKDSI